MQHEKVSENEKYDMGKLTIFLVGVLIIAIPKMGGSIASGVPLYASVVFGSALGLYGWLTALRVSKDLFSQIGLLMITVIFFIWVGHFFILMGGDLDARRTARMVFNFVPFVGLGIAYYIVYEPDILEFSVTVTRFGFYFLLLYAGLQLVFGADVVAIQYVTANYDESFDEIIRKTNVIHRLGGESYKLFGTYQNGNLFSIALILIAPFAFWSEKNIFVTILAFIALHVVIIYSASTTSYLSILLMDGIILFTTQRIFRILPVIFVMLFLFVTIFFYVCSQDQCQIGSLLQAKLFDRDLTQNLRWDKTLLWLDSIEANIWVFFVGEMSTAKVFVFEVLPFSIAQYFGIFSMILFYAFLLIALNPTRFAMYKIGLMVYVVTSVGSGGFWLTPIPYILGFVCGLIIALDRSYELRSTPLTRYY